MRWALWWFAVFAAYVITVLAQNAGEVVAGAIIAALSTIPVAVALRNGDCDVRVRWKWVRHLAAVPARMVSEALLVARRIVYVLVRGENLEGYFVRVPYDAGNRENAWTMGREALVIYGVNAGPNSMVADVDLRGELVVHKLVATEQTYESPEWPL